MSIFGIWIRGLVMGAADTVPGVSGGTVAFLTGIYFRWLAVLTAVHPRLWGIFKREGMLGLWRALDGAFVIPLVTGILMSIFTMAHWIENWLATVPERVWGFFFGLVIAMGLSLLGNLKRKVIHDNWIFYFLIGLFSSAMIGFVAPEQTDPALWMWPIVGAMALAAMLLPGISGSFLLLLTGFYPALIAALSEFDLTVLLLFLLGGAVGIFMMAHMLRYLFNCYEIEVLSCLTGIIFGALVRVWPWQSLALNGQLNLYFPDSDNLFIPLGFIIFGFSIAFLGVRFLKSVEGSAW